MDNRRVLLPPDLGLREQLTTIFETARSRRDGLRQIRLWCTRGKESGLKCFDNFLSLLDTWGELIANYFIDHQTSGFVEGLNNKLEVLKRRCYGIRNVGRLFRRLTLDLDGYMTTPNKPDPGRRHGLWIRCRCCSDRSNFGEPPD